MATFIAFVQTNLVGSKVEDEFEVPDDELRDLDDDARDELISGYAQDVLSGCYEWGWTEVE